MAKRASADTFWLSCLMPWSNHSIGGRRHSQSCAEVVPEHDFELGTGLGEGEEGIAAVTPDITARATTDLAPGDVAADVVLRPIGVQRNLGPFEHHQQLGLVGVEPREQTVEGDEAGLARE